MTGSQEAEREGKLVNFFTMLYQLLMLYSEHTEGFGGVIMNEKWGHVIA
jgi:hypothetical protein